MDGIYIFNNNTLTGHGDVVYGSYTAAGLKNVWAVENFFRGTDIGFRFKTGTGHGGGIGPLGPNDVGFVGQDNIGKTSICMVVTDEYGDPTRITPRRDGRIPRHHPYQLHLLWILQS